MSAIKSSEKPNVFIQINNINLVFETSSDLFSPNAPDKGTLAMLNLADFENKSKILDLGCGWGLTGIYAAKLIGEENVFMSDISERAVEISKKNALLNNVQGVTVIQSDGFKEINEKDFSLILSNPPYHTDFSVAKHFIEKGFNRLTVGGELIMVTKRREWYKNKLVSVFGGTKITESGGYFIFTAQKRNNNYAKSVKI
ncbi:MAG: methyltransferase [Oscillospiraceae bacterium]|nr:methyltransferase [Oscillospiraceae bacterium]